jgi:hypothetical protein
MEFTRAVACVRSGMAAVVPIAVVSLFTAAELEQLVCGVAEIDIGLLRGMAIYEGIAPDSNLVTWFWEVMEELSQEERALFLRFTWGRTRLPRTSADFKGRHFKLQVVDRERTALPQSYTCFFQLKLPRYADKPTLKAKLIFAIYHCRAIDTDFNADSADEEEFDDEDLDLDEEEGEEDDDGDAYQDSHFL